MLSPGTHVGPYRVVEHVGAEGTMAEVYRAETDAGLTVAVKLLGVGREPRIQREIDASCRLHHPHIVNTLDAVEWKGRLCLVQEWVDGPSLATILDEEGRLSLAETVRLGQDVGEALAHAHGLGLLHRDLKPSNVLRGADGRYKLVDFGAVGLLESDGLTSSGEIAGTPLYMAPEQAVGRRQTPATDVFGLGLLLYRALYGTTPGATAADYLTLLVGRSRTRIAVPPSRLQRIIYRCLAIEPAHRPQSARDVVDALTELDVLPAPPVPAGHWQQPRSHDAAVVIAPGGVVAGQTAAAKRAATWPGLAIATAVVVAVVVAAVLAPDATAVGFWLRLVAGLVVVGAALVAARQVRRLAGREPEAQRQAAGILSGAGGRDALTTSMVVEVDQVVAKLKTLDAKLLGYTMVMLINEAEKAPASADRVAALAQLVTVMEKVMKQLSPWHVRHKEAIATVIAVVGSLVGIASVVSGFLK